MTPGFKSFTVDDYIDTPILIQKVKSAKNFEKWKLRCLLVPTLTVWYLFTSCFSTVLRFFSYVFMKCKLFLVRVNLNFFFWMHYLASNEPGLLIFRGKKSKISRDFQAADISFVMLITYQWVLLIFFFYYWNQNVSMNEMINSTIFTWPCRSWRHDYQRMLRWPEPIYMSVGYVFESRFSAETV